jgi:hypothetical protein
MPTRRVLITLAALFLLTLVWRLPARWVSAALPAAVSCEQASGTLWNGGCDSLLAAGMHIHGLRWQWQPGQLLHGNLGVAMQINDAQAQASLLLLASLGGSRQIRDLRAQLPLTNSLIPGLPAGWDGRVVANLPLLQWQASELAAVQGTLQIRELRQLQPALQFGSYELRFGARAPTNGTVSAVVRDLDGPLRVAGTLQISGRGEYELNAMVATTTAADAELTQIVEQLGAADAQGNRVFSVSGTL